MVTIDVREELKKAAKNPAMPKVLARKIGAILADASRRGDRRRDVLLARIEHEFEKRKPGRFGDGEFAKWMLAWLQGGGFEKLMGWIAAIMALFA